MGSRRWARLLIPLCLARPIAGQAADTPTLFPLRVEEELRIDGWMEEAAWSQAWVITDFRQHEPDEGAPATERTEVRILYNARALFIGVICYDREPGKLVARKLQRDDQLEEDDTFRVVLDTFHDHRNAFYFATNPSGAEEDALLTDEDRRNLNRDWDGVWEVKARITAQGWVVEIAIPFWTLRFPRGPEQTWGINFSRVIKRKNEEVLWTSWTRDNGGLFRVSLAGHLQGVNGLEPGLNLQLKPFFLSTLSQDRSQPLREIKKAKGDSGLDVKYGLTPGLTLDLTLNTDFAQVEADVQQINLTRFSLFFPEKREFFLENAGLFDFGVRGFFGPPPLLFFFSRRIGLNQGQEVPILAGGRVTGKVGKFNLGFLEMVTDETPGTPRTNFAVARVKRDIFRQSSVGAIFTNRDEAGGRDNQAYGVDTRLQLSNAWRFDAFYAETRTPGVGRREAAGRLSLDLTSDHYGGHWEYLFIGQNFAPGVGFVRRGNMGRGFATFRVSPRPHALGIRKIDLRSSLEYIEDDGHGIQDRTYEFNAVTDFESGDRLRFELGQRLERLDEPFQIRPTVLVPVGDYENTSYQLEFASAVKRPLSGRLSVTREGFFSGYRTTLGVGADLRPSQHFSLEATYERNEADLRDGDFSTDLVNLRLNYAFSTKFFTNTLIQYNSDTRQITTNFRLDFIHTPGSDLFVVYNETRGGGPSVTPLQTRALFVKFTYLFNL